jgi:serpin B
LSAVIPVNAENDCRIQQAFISVVVTFAGVTAAVKLFVTAVIQKAFIEVNEEGSEAAAATAVLVRCCSMELDSQFLCDRPFLYFIRDNLTGLILFAGKLVNPAKN